MSPHELGPVIAALERLPAILHDTRKQRGMTLEQAAEELGVFYTTVWRWENGRVHISVQNALRILRWAAS
jgi:transcriptional regulator with XRE-family HTH domain